MEIKPTKHIINHDLGDLEDYFRLRQQDIEREDFAERCKSGLEKNRGPIPKLTKKW